MLTAAVFEELFFVDPKLVRPHQNLTSCYELNGGVWTLQEGQASPTLLDKELFFALDMRITERNWRWERHGGVFRVVVVENGKQQAVNGKPGLSLAAGLASAYCAACRVRYGMPGRMIG